MRVRLIIPLLTALIAAAGLASGGDAIGKAMPRPREVLRFSACLQSASVADSSCTPVPELGGGGDVAFSPDGRSVYVAAPSESPSAEGALLVFGRDPTSGALSLRQCFEDVLGADDPGCANVPGLKGSSSVAVTSDGRSVYVGGESAFVAFSRDGVTGRLNPVQCFDDGTARNEPSCAVSPDLSDGSDVVASPDGRFIYATGTRDRGSRGEFAAITVFRRDPATSALSHSSVSTPTLKQLRHSVNTVTSEIFGLASDPSGRFMYLVDRQMLVQLRRNRATGALAFKSCRFGGVRRGPITCPHITGLRGPMDVATGPKGWVYSVAPDSASIVALRARGRGGFRAERCLSQKRLRGCGRIQQGLSLAQSVAVSPDGRSVYVGSPSGTLLALDARAGRLRREACFLSAQSRRGRCRPAPGLEEVDAEAMSPDGRSLITVGGNSLDLFSRTPR